MEILLTGNTEFITPEWIKSAFPSEHVLVTRSSTGNYGDKRLKTVEIGKGHRRGSLLGQLNSTYEFERIIYFSDYLTPHTEAEGELDHLRRILQSCVDISTEFLYISGPVSTSSVSTGKSLLAKTAEELCRHYAQTGKVKVKILRTPYLYAADMHGVSSYFERLFKQVRAGKLAFDEPPSQQAAFLCMEDLSELLGFIFDSWDEENDEYNISDQFHLTFEQFGTILARQNPGTKVSYGTDALWTMQPDDGVLRKKFAWYPRYSVLEDIPEMYGAWQAEQEKEQGFWQKLWTKLTSRSHIMVLAETAVCWLASDLLVKMTGSQAQFSVVDFRLLFVVLIGTVHGLYAGLLAAVLACVSLALGYYADGASFVTLFYEPSNWLGFIAYFVAGAVCGYVRLRSNDAMHFEQEESKRLRDRLTFISRLYQDTLADKRSFRRQIIGRQDSFGKIYSVTQQLDTMQPQELYIKTVQVMEDLLKNHTIMIYRVDENSSFARLTAACSAIMPTAKRSVDLAGHEKMLVPLREGKLWVNRELEPDTPMFASAVRRNDRIAVIIFVRDAEGDQLSLYYQNLFRILCGLVENSLLRAFDYENATHEERYLPGSCLLRVEPFGECLCAANQASENKIGTHLLLRVSGTFKSREDMYEKLQSAKRDSDIAGVAPDGSICLLLNQASEANLPIIQKRMETHGLTVTSLGIEDEIRLISMLPENTGGGHK